MLAVYAAGYARTRAAAQRLASDEQRRPMIPAPAESGPPQTMPEPPAVPTLTPARTQPASHERSALESRHHGSGHAPALDMAADAPAATPADHTPATTPVATTSAIATSTGASATTAAANTTAVVPPMSATETKPAEPAPPVPQKPALKDGTYYGWGTSRHGDIQASVVIENGRITHAAIAQCLTRYSCSWIAPLVPQVVLRQGADVDYVSGATQSTYAFYYAVLEALSKAK